jgi:hypothetical protein
MTESLTQIMKLLDEVAAHLQADSTSERSAARRKLERVTVLASILALTLKNSR